MIIDELESLAALETFVWERMHEFCGCLPGDLRAECLRTAHVSVGFMQFRFLAELAKPLWELVSGDVAEGVELLCMGDEPSDVVLQKAWRLHSFGPLG